MRWQPIESWSTWLAIFTTVCFSGVLLASSGCVQAPFGGFSKLATPWSTGDAEDAELADTLFEKKARMDAAVSAVRNGPVEQQQKVANGLGEIIRRDPILLLRLHAVKLASQLRCPAAVNALEIASTDPGMDIRIAAVKAWESMPSELAIGNLQEIIGSDTNVDVRLAAVRSLGKFSGRQAVNAISLALNDSDPALQLRATESLALASGETFGPNVAAWQNYVARLDGPATSSNTQRVAARPSETIER